MGRKRNRNSGYRVGNITNTIGVKGEVQNLVPCPAVSWIVVGEGREEGGGSTSLLLLLFFAVDETIVVSAGYQLQGSFDPCKEEMKVDEN